MAVTLSVSESISFAQVTAAAGSTAVSGFFFNEEKRLQALDFVAKQKGAAWSASAASVTNTSQAQETLRGYVAEEILFVEYSYKLGATTALDTYRHRCATALSKLSAEYSIQPQYNWIEKGLIWFEANSRR